MSTFRTSGDMCAVLLSYVRPLDEVDAQLAAHVAWLEQGFAEGVFLIAGRRQPRSGGVIVMRGARAAVDAVMATDPFVASGVATFEVVPFSASFAATPLHDWLS
ncbi:YciI family protein [Sphingomonas phyllosphaerae]|jgi:uncharacterized protein YciI|uniref:YciI family protein n=1 Tax=Sphingomonas phyllosphaerae TaxID=257003 RepID=UPI0003B6BDBD|nr:YciI family protein [Sphingomonas phyllosphaerae]